MANLDEETLRAKFEEAQQVVNILVNFVKLSSSFRGILRVFICWSGIINVIFFFRLLYPKVHMKIFLIWSQNTLVNKRKKDKRLRTREQQQETQVLVEVQGSRNIRNSSFNYA